MVAPEDRIVFGLVCVLVASLLVATAMAGAFLFMRDRGGHFRPAVRFWWNLVELYCRWWQRLRREGPCTIPPQGPVILVANHTCGVDPLLLVASIPHRVPAFLIGEEFYDIPLARHVVRMIECIPVKRDGQDAAGVKAALRHLKQGKLLGIFIEGRIPEPDEVLPAKDGAAMLALRSGALVVPAHISGTGWHRTLTGSFLRRHHAVVRFGQPVNLRELAGRKADKEMLGGISALLLQRIRDLAGVTIDEHHIGQGGS